MKKFILCFVIGMASFLMGCAANIRDGVALLEEGKYQDAVTCFERDITEEKNLYEAYRGAAIGYYELEEYELAADCFQKALENEAEETATIYSLMAASYLQLDEFGTALQYYDKAISMEDCTEEMKQEILFNEIAIYQEMGEWETVAEKVSVYVETYPEDTRMNKTVEFLETR